MRTFLRYFGMLALAVVFLSFAFNNDRLFEISKNIEIYVNVYKELNKNYVDDVDPSELMRKGIDAMVGSLDPYTNYISESQIESYRISDDSKYEGIGASIIQVGDRMLLANLKENSPAAQGGLAAGDELKSLNGTPVAGKTAEDLNNLLRGVVGTPVKLEVKKADDGVIETSQIERGEVNIPNVPYSGFVSKDVGYITLTTFTENSAANISKALKELKRENENMKGLIIDLRENGGGLLREAVSICNIFVPKGEEIVTIKGKVKSEDRGFKATAVPEDLDIPLVVLVNKHSASASEIVSGVLQDLDRAVIMGQRSYGKGLVQNFFELGYNNRMKITTAKYYIPSGRCIQGVEYTDGSPVNISDEKRSKFKTRNGRLVLDGGGVTPDITLPEPTHAEYTQALLDQNIIFDFVTQYIQSIDTIKDLENYDFKDFKKFESFVNEKKFSYKAKGQKELADIAKQYENHPDLNAFSKKLATISTEIDQSKREGLSKYKDDIIHEIEKEIASRFYYEKGSTIMKLKRDAEVDEAVKLFAENVKYRQLLR